MLKKDAPNASKAARAFSLEVNKEPADAKRPKGKGKGRFRAKLAKGSSKGSGFNTQKVAKKTTEAMKKTCTMNFQKLEDKYRAIRLATSELWMVIAYRVQTALAVSSQFGKLKTSWPALVMIEYISHWTGLLTR